MPEDRVLLFIHLQEPQVLDVQTIEIGKEEILADLSKELPDVLLLEEGPDQVGQDISRGIDRAVALLGEQVGDDLDNFVDLLGRLLEVVSPVLLLGDLPLTGVKDLFAVFLSRGILLAVLDLLDLEVDGGWPIDKLVFLLLVLLKQVPVEPVLEDL